jgi:O-antigen/teichoic acid export membrane protein
MGPGFELTIEILYILVIPACIYLPQVTSNSILLGIEKHRLLLYILIGEAISNVVFSLILVQFIGLHGVALGTAIPQVIIYISVYPVVYHRVLKASLKNFYLQSARMIAIAALITVPTALLMKTLLPADGWLSFFADVGTICVAILAGFVFLILERGDRNRILSAIRR